MGYEKFQECIDLCYRCAVACDNCSVACLTEPDVEKMADCIRTDIDCAQICRFAAGAMARNSDFAEDICELCASVCRKCADICGMHNHDHCQACAKACRLCADECERMAA